jgi:hypothetical protein
MIVFATLVFYLFTNDYSMTTARKNQIDLNVTPYYHITNRCVRRAFLCGINKKTGDDYEHRRQWIVDRLKLLAEVFTIDICSYAIMSNHFHLVLHVDVEKMKALKAYDVIDRWIKPTGGTDLARQFRKHGSLDEQELKP